MLSELKFKKNIRSLAYEIVIFISLCICCFYFSLVAMNGNHGVKKKAELMFVAIEIREQLAGLQKTANELEEKTRKLQDEFLDIDLLDQQARKILGLIRLDEIIIIE